MGEPPAAEAARVRPLARVDPPVDLQRSRLAEALPAVRAGVGPGAGVHVEVYAQVALRVEGPAALGAEEAGRLVGVLGALVLQQLRRPGERGRAVHAGMQRQQRPAPLFLLLRVLVLADRTTRGEGALAGQAGVGSRKLCRAR